jgi:MYXO-CTERM domain-containing protein
VDDAVGPTLAIYAIAALALLAVILFARRRRR